jgi:hypothetical protein
MRRIIGALSASALLLSPGWAPCADHLVAPRTLAERMAGAAIQRQEDTRAVDRVLARTEAAAAARALGTRIEDVRAAVPNLSDQELRNLAERASALQADPVSGHIDANEHDLLVIFLVVAIVVLVVAAVR